MHALFPAAAFHQSGPLLEGVHDQSRAIKFPSACMQNYIPIFDSRVQDKSVGITSQFKGHRYQIFGCLRHDKLSYLCAACEGHLHI